MAPNNRVLAGIQAASEMGVEALDQGSTNVVAGPSNAWINQQQRDASLVPRSNGALDGSISYDPCLIVPPSASRASEQNFFDLDFGRYNPQFDADAEAQTNAEKADDLPAMNLELEPEHAGNFEAHNFHQNTPDPAETSSEIFEEQTVAAVGRIESAEPILVPENQIQNSSQLSENSDVEVPESRSAQDPIALDSQAATSYTPQLVQSQVPRPGAGAGPHQIPNVAGVQIVASAAVTNISGNQIPRPIAPNILSTTGVQQPPATTNTGARRSRYVTKIQTRPPRTRGPLQQRPIPVWPEFIHVTPAVRANAAGHEAALRMITHARNVPGLKTLKNTDLITSSTRSGDTPGDWKPVVIANFLHEWIRQNYNGLMLWNKEGKTFREQINWYDRRPLMEQADIRIFITEQVETLLPAADQQRIAQLRQNFQGPVSQLASQVANGTWQPPIFGPPSAAFLAEVAAHDAAAAATQVNSGTQINQMGSGLGGGPVVGTGGPSSSQSPAASGGSGASSSVAGGIQAPQPPGNNQGESRKRGRDDDSDTQDAIAQPPSKKSRQSVVGLNAAIQASSLPVPSIGEEILPSRIKRDREDEGSENSVIIDDPNGEEPQLESPPPRKRTRRARAGTQSNLQGMGGASTRNVESMRNLRQSNSSSRRSQADRGTQEGQGRHQGKRNQENHRTASQFQTGNFSNESMKTAVVDMYPDPGLYELGPARNLNMNNDFESPNQNSQTEAYNSFSTREPAGRPYIDPASYGYDEHPQSTRQSAFENSHQAQDDSPGQPSRGSEPGTMSFRGDGESQNLNLGNYAYHHSMQSGVGTTRGQSMHGFSDNLYGMIDGGSSMYGHTRNSNQQDDNDDGWSVPEIPEDESHGFW